MNNRASIFSAATALLLGGAPAQAATATVVSFVNTRLHNPNGVGLGGCGNGSNGVVACQRVDEQPLLASDLDGVGTQVSIQREEYLSAPAGQVPNYILEGSARAYALPGSLHAIADVEIVGIGGGTGGGVTAFASVLVEDTIKVTSATLANGTAVLLTTRLAVSGTGRADLSLKITGKVPGLPGISGVFGGRNYSDEDDEGLDDISGQFTAYVGRTYFVDYYLQASAGVSNSGWRQADVINGRAATSDYVNSAYLSFASADPAVQWVSGSGASYIAAVVPEPGTYAMMLLGLVCLGAIAKRKGSRSFAV